MDPFIKVMLYILGVVLGVGLYIIIKCNIEIAILTRQIKQYEGQEMYRKKLWGWFTDAVKDMSYVGEGDLATRFTYHNRYDVCIWKETGLASIHVSVGRECILSTFDKTESKLLADKLLESITI